MDIYFSKKKLITDVSDLYEIKENDLVNLEGFASKSASNLITSIKSSKDTSFQRFIYALGIREVGEATALNLALNFTDLKKLMTASIEDLLGINEIGPVAANFIKDYFTCSNNINLVSLVHLDCDVYPACEESLSLLFEMELLNDIWFLHFDDWKLGTEIPEWFSKFTIPIKEKWNIEELFETRYTKTFKFTKK